MRAIISTRDKVNESIDDPKYIGLSQLTLQKYGDYDALFIIQIGDKQIGIWKNETGGYDWFIMPLNESTVITTVNGTLHDIFESIKSTLE